MRATGRSYIQIVKEHDAVVRFTTPQNASSPFYGAAARRRHLPSSGPNETTSAVRVMNKIKLQNGNFPFQATAPEAQYRAAE